MKRERGAGRLKTILGLLFLGALVYVGIKVVPAYINNYQLEDAMQTEARFALVNRKSEQDIRDAIFRKVQDLEIHEVRREDIRIETSNDRTRINVNYSVVVNLPGYQLKLDFHPSADSRAI